MSMQQMGTAPQRNISRNASGNAAAPATVPGKAGPTAPALQKAPAKQAQGLHPGKV